MNKYLKSLAFLPLAILISSQSGYAGVTPPNSPLQSRRSDNEVRVLMDDVLSYKAKSQKGAHARNQLAFLLICGEIDTGTIDYQTVAAQLKQVIAEHGPETVCGARARCLLAVARARGLVEDNLITCPGLVVLLNEVIAAHGGDTILGATARINLAALRATRQIGDDVLGAHDAIQLTMETIAAAEQFGLAVDVEAANENYRLLRGEVLQADVPEPDTKRSRVSEDVVPPLFGDLDELPAMNDGLEMGVPMEVDTSLDESECPELEEFPPEIFGDLAPNNASVAPGVVHVSKVGLN